MHKYTALVLAFGVLSVLVRKTVEWGHLPLLEIGGWFLCGLLNWRHTNKLRDFYEDDSFVLRNGGSYELQGNKVN